TAAWRRGTLFDFHLERGHPTRAQSRQAESGKRRKPVLRKPTRPTEEKTQAKRPGSYAAGVCLRNAGFSLLRSFVICSLSTPRGSSLRSSVPMSQAKI